MTVIAFQCIELLPLKTTQTIVTIPFRFAFFVVVLNRFLQRSPLLSEFESQIIFYRDLELEINSEPEFITVGALALFTGEAQL